MLVDAAGNHHRLERHRLRTGNQTVGDAGACLKLPHRLATMRPAFFQFQRSHPVATIADQQKIAAALRACWKEAIHVYQRIRGQIAINLRPASIRCAFCYATSARPFAELAANGTDKAAHERTPASR